MIIFLLKGLSRDRHRSRFPLITVAVGSLLTVLVFAWISGVSEEMIDTNARFNTGHLRLMTMGYAQQLSQMPVELALDRADEWIVRLNERFPQYQWIRRCRFGGMVDVADTAGETRLQAPTQIWAIGFQNGSGGEIERLELLRAMVAGAMPRSRFEVLLSAQLAKSLAVAPGDTISLLSSTVYGNMSMVNLVIAGTLNFGVQAMDRGAMMIDLAAAEYILDLPGSATEILGFQRNGRYQRQSASAVRDQFNADVINEKNELSPRMMALEDQNDLAMMIEYVDTMRFLIVLVFVFTMSLVLWNSGLLSGIRRYNEFGLRLAIGESKSAVFFSLMLESLLIALAGSLIGTLLGAAAAFYLQEVGIDTSAMMKNVGLFVPSVYRARLTLVAVVMGFVPGTLALLLGRGLAGIAVYRRQTAQLFRELET